MSDQKHVRLELTEEQKAQVKAATGKDAALAVAGGEPASAASGTEPDNP